MKEKKSKGGFGKGKKEREPDHLSFSTKKIYLSGKRESARPRKRGKAEEAAFIQIQKEKKVFFSRKKRKK